jgi:hypothetical protein
MQSFKDEKGREWTLQLNVTTATELKRDADVDVYAMLKDRLASLPELLEDSPRLAGALYLLCRDQAAKASITAEDFGHGLTGDSLADAGEAFTRAVIDFFPDRGRRPLLMQILEKSREIAQAMTAEGIAKVAGIDARTLRDSPGNGAESSASTLAASPSANSP